MCESLNRDGKSTGQSEVSKLESALGINQNVLWLKISVDETVHVAVRDAEHHLVHQALETKESTGERRVGMILGCYLDAFWSDHALVRSHVLLQVLIAPLEDQVQLGLCRLDILEAATESGSVPSLVHCRSSHPTVLGC